MTENPTSLRGKVLSGLFWKVLENGGVQIVQFVISLILARMLGPERYGTIALLLVFIAIANVFIQSGFQTALIQKRQVDDLDYSSVFYLGLGVALLLYAVIFAGAPAVAAFYHDPELKSMLRVLALMIFFGAVVSVQTAMVSRKMEFRKMCAASLLATCLSGIAGVIGAYRGLGTWALVVQQLGTQFLLMVFLWVLVGWKPMRAFSFSRVKALFSYGWKLLCSSLLDTVYNNLYTMVIGRIYQKDVVGYYNRGNQFPQLIVNNLAASIQAVMLPAFSASQEDKERMKAMVRRSIVTSAFVIFPMMAGLVAVAKPLISIILTEKWLPCVPFLQIMCVAYAMWPIHIANLQAINALGRSDIFLKLEIIKKALGLAVLAVSIPFGIYAMVWLKASTDFVGTIINAYPNKKLLNYSFLEQWRDVFPALILSVVMGAIVYSLQFFIHNNWILLTAQISGGVLIYGGLAWIFKIESFRYLLGVVKGFQKR
ncbi:MAG: lipopolysaccharide biosynthesis protein [Lachnospiraceae bacterium]|nr:lipopolysaccharide biosynthesis protein [Lachnospiraceae bacterium]